MIPHPKRGDLATVATLIRNRKGSLDLTIRDGAAPVLCPLQHADRLMVVGILVSMALRLPVPDRQFYGPAAGFSAQKVSAF